jgi:hypothetical protein
MRGGAGGVQTMGVQDLFTFVTDPTLVEGAEDAYLEAVRPRCP